MVCVPLENQISSVQCEIQGKLRMTCLFNTLPLNPKIFDLYWINLLKPEMNQRRHIANTAGQSQLRNETGRESHSF